MTLDQRKTENMKATFFYSQRQKQIVSEYAQTDDLRRTSSFIDGKEYTEMQTGDYEHKSNFEDAIVIAEINNLPSETMLGKKYANIGSISNRITATAMGSAMQY